MSAHIQQASVLSGRSLVMVVTIALHALVIAGLMTSRYIEVTPIQLDRSIYVDPRDQPKSTGDLVPIRISNGITQPKTEELVPRLPDIYLNDESPPAGQAGEGFLPGTGQSGEVVGRPQLAPTELAYRAVRSPDEFYPATSLRLQEEGVSVVRVCVSAYGQITSAPTIATSSGSRRLDAAAVLWAREALEFTPATRDGAAVAACKGFRVNFTLH